MVSIESVFKISISSVPGSSSARLRSLDSFISVPLDRRTMEVDSSAGAAGVSRREWERRRPGMRYETAPDASWLTCGLEPCERKRRRLVERVRHVAGEDDLAVLLHDHGTAARLRAGIRRRVEVDPRHAA